MIESDLLSAISRQWGMAFTRLRPDLHLTGSPERTTWRSVAETNTGRLFVLEKIPSRRYDRKRQIFNSLKKLSEQGLAQAVSYLPAIDGEAIPLIAHGLWQLCPFVPGIDLNRPAYVMDAWRGDAAAAFLIRLHKISSANGILKGTSAFSIADYSTDLYNTLSRKHPSIAGRYRKFMDHLHARLFPVHDSLPTGFCHGDYHPINIIWGEQSIRSVIDWEFCGIKPEIYDLANLLGCLGMEDPHCLSGPLVRQLISRLKRSDIFSHRSWEALPDLVLAIRFAWLSEWMRKNDREMIHLEAEYMSLLLSHGPNLTHDG